MIAEEHLWETADGGLVPTGHPDAMFLKYAAGDEVPDKVIAELTGDTKQRTPQASKSRPKPADKQAPKPDDK